MTPVPKTILVFRWMGLLGFVCSFCFGIYGILAKIDLLETLIAFLLGFVGTIVSVLQVDKHAFAFVLRSKDVGAQVFGTFLILFSVGLSCYNFFAPRVIHGPEAPLETVVVPTVERLTSSSSDLLPNGIAPLQLLDENGQLYAWDTGENRQHTGRCDLIAGAYTLSAPATSPGIGCNTENDVGVFHNFVYQVKMTIVQGIADGEVGPTFRVNDSGAGYQVSFNQNGYYSVTSDLKSLSHDLNPFSFFVEGAGASNYLTIRMVGTTLDVEVNGYRLGHYQDSELTTGYVGVQMTPGTGDGRVAFTDMQLWQLP